MLEDTRKFLNKEADVCDEIWDEHYEKNSYLDHFHVCDFQLLGMLTRGKDSFRKYNKYCEKKCEEYLHSIGHERDEDMNCCDYCPHMRYLTLSADDYFLNIATLGMDRFLFDEEKETNVDR